MPTRSDIVSLISNRAQPSRRRSFQGRGQKRIAKLTFNVRASCILTASLVCVMQLRGVFVVVSVPSKPVEDTFKERLMPVSTRSSLCCCGGLGLARARARRQLTLEFR